MCYPTEPVLYHLSPASRHRISQSLSASFIVNQSQYHNPSAWQTPSNHCAAALVAWQTTANESRLWQGNSPMGGEELQLSRCSGRQVSERAGSLRAIVYSLPTPGLIYLTTLLPMHIPLVKTKNRLAALRSKLCVNFQNKSLQRDYKFRQWKY